MTTTRADRTDGRMLAIAARLAVRAAGDVEPNPLVGCVIGRRLGNEVEILGMGHHRRFGGAHAEIEALRDVEARGASARGATAWVTLEPCGHQGKTGSCAEALAHHGVRRVVMARRDPHRLASGGIERLQQEGVETVVTDASAAATRLSDPFVKRVTTGLPWVIVKWAQTMDGKIATREGASQWISGQRSRATAHRLRARVDVVMTGIGTVMADDPRLTARGVRRVRRVAKRVVIDPNLNMTRSSALVESVGEAPLIVVCDGEVLESAEGRRGRAELEERGGLVWGMERDERGVDLRAVMERLVGECDATNVLVEAGPGLVGRLLEGGFVDEARVYTGPLMLGDEAAPGAARGRFAPSLSDGARFELERVKRVGGDVLGVWRRME